MSAPRPIQVRKLLHSRAGFVFIFFALALLVLLGLTGLALDTARGVVTKAEVSRVADAAALAGAKNVRAGTGGAEALAKAVAAANGVEPDASETLNVSVTKNDDDETQVSVRATRRIDTTFMRVLGVDDMNVESSAEATVPPIDIVLVLDQSQSMLNPGPGGGRPWSRLVPAAKLFVQQFSDVIDQVGLVHFSTMGEVAFPMQGNFTARALRRINQMKPSGDTNGEEALSFAYQEITGRKSRPKALKVVVFFTDGRPTAFRDNDSDMGNKDGILTVPPRSSYGNIVLGWYSAPQDPPSLIKPDDPFKYAAKCAGVAQCKIPGGKTWNRDDVLQAAHDKLVENAEIIRTSGVFIYSIGLGNLTGNVEEQPDQDILKEIANVDGTGNGTTGGYFFARTPEDLARVFQDVAADILARLSQ